MFYQPQGRSGRGFVNKFFSFLIARNPLSRLILINTIFLVIIALSELYAWLYNVNAELSDGVNFLAYYLATPADVDQLIMRPWTIFTSMFVHEGFLHYFFNMIMLYFSGLIFTSFLKPNKLVFSYVLGGISGVIFYVAAFNTFPVFEPVLAHSLALGASAAVMSVLFSAVAYTPDFSIRLLFLGEVKLKYLAIIFVLLDVLSIKSGNAGGHIAHIGGAVFGIAYGFFLRKNFSFRLKMPYKKSAQKRKRVKMKVNRRPESDEEFLQRKAEKNDRIDEILDKISKGGYNSLSKEEKDFLFKFGK